MIDRALVFLRDQLNLFLARSGGGAAAGLEEPVALIEGDKLDPLTLKVGAISVLLVNLEQDQVMRRDDPFQRTLPDGSIVRAHPDIRLNLWVLFVARFNAYEAALAALSAVLRFFQAHPIFDTRSAPELDAGIERLIVELHTLPLTEQNDLWGSLRLAYHPSLLFKVRMILVQDAEALPAVPVSEPRIEMAHAVQAAS